MGKTARKVSLPPLLSCVPQILAKTRIQKVGKTARKVSLPPPLSCVPQILAKTRTQEEQCPQMLASGGSRVYQQHTRTFMRTLAKSGQLWPTYNAIFTRTSLTFTRVPAKVPHLHQSSGEGAFCMWVAFRMCPNASRRSSGT